MTSHAGKYKPIRHFTDIYAHELGRKLKVQIYKITAHLPASEKYNLTQQMQRCGVSITANIAEEYGRYHYQETMQYCRQSRGSMYEQEDHLLSCLDLNYISKAEFDNLYNLTQEAIFAINGYIRFINKSKQNDNRGPENQ